MGLETHAVGLGFQSQKAGILPVPSARLLNPYEPPRDLPKAIQHVLETQQFILGEQVAVFRCFSQTEVS
jgi:hypothetical protein